MYSSTAAATIARDLSRFRIPPEVNFVDTPHLKPDTKMPKEVRDIKQFITIATRKDAKSARVKKTPPKVAGGKTVTKFKIRCSRYLYTLTLDDVQKAERLQQSLPPGLQIQELSATKTKKK